MGFQLMLGTTGGEEWYINLTINLQRKPGVGAHDGEECPLCDMQVQMQILTRSSDNWGQSAHDLIQLSLSILAYERDTTPIITSSKQCDCELKLLAQNLTHSKYLINAHGYYCIICYHYCYYIENFTANFPLPCRMLLGTTCLCMLLIIFEILSCTCMLGWVVRQSLRIIFHIENTFSFRIHSSLCEYVSQMIF